MEKLIAIIPARGGSKGLKNKNILNIHHKPLIAWSILFARQSKYIERCIVSTDSEEIADVSRQYGAEVPFIRDKHLATDSAKSSDVILDTIIRCKLDEEQNMLLLEPTSPYRTNEDMELIANQLKLTRTNKCVSVSVAKSDHYSFQYHRNKIGGLKNIQPSKNTNNVRRQEVDDTYYLNGTFYTSNIGKYIENPEFVDESTQSVITSYLSGLEIDTLEDFKLMKAIFSYNGAPFDNV